MNSFPWSQCWWRKPNGNTFDIAVVVQPCLDRPVGPAWAEPKGRMQLLRRKIRKECEMPHVTAAQSRGVGRIVTFYSFKGGTGRTMALANVAWILAANGKRVLVADWDLESPGLHRFFQPFMETEVNRKAGIVDFIRGYEWAIDEADRRGRLNVAAERAGEVAKIIDAAVRDVSHLVVPVRWRFPDDGAIHFLSPG